MTSLKKERVNSMLISQRDLKRKGGPATPGGASTSRPGCARAEEQTAEAGTGSSQVWQVNVLELKQQLTYYYFL